MLSNVMYWPSDRQAGAPFTNIQSTLRTSTGLCKNVSLEVLFGTNSNSYTVSTHSDMCICICTYMLHNTQPLVERKKEKGLGQLRMWRAKELFRLPFWAQVL
jgi:hypothetical protein